MENIEKKIAEWMQKDACSNSESGSWIIYFEEIEEEFDVNDRWVAQHADEIANYLDWNIVAEYEIGSDYFDLTIYTDYLENCYE